MSAPYAIGHNTASSGTTQTITVTTGTSPGDAIIVACGNSSSSGATVTGITDSAGNSYSRLITAAVTSNEFGDVWAALPQANGGTTAQLTTSGTITVTWSATSGEKAHLAVGVPGVAVSSALDQQASAHNTNTSPGVSTGTLAQASEIVLAFLCNQDTAAPGSLSLTEVGQYQGGTSPYVTVCYEDTSSAGAVSLTASFSVSANWAAIIVTLLPAAAGNSPAPLMAAGII